MTTHRFLTSQNLAALLFLFALLTAVSVQARDLMSLIPSTRWIMLNSPFRPTSHEECNKFAQEFAEVVAQLNAQHEECLQGTPSEPSGSEGCSKVSCQALHSARDAATKKSSREAGECRDEVSQHLAKKREEETRRQQAADKSAREDAEQATKNKAERLEDERDRKDQDAQKESDRKARESADSRDRATRDVRERAEHDKLEKERQAALAKAERESADRAKRDTALAGASARRETELKIARDREEAAKLERDRQEQSVYLELVEKLRGAKEKVETAVEFAANPFEKGAAMLSDGIASALVDKGLDIAAPIGPEKKDPRYEAIAEGVDGVRGKGLENNPFADKISGLAMEGIHKINRQLLGQVDELGKQVEGIAQDGAQTSRSPPTYRPPPPTVTSTSAARREAPSSPVDRNPFEPQSETDRVALANPSSRGRVNPFENETTSPTYDDPDTGRQYSIPAGHTMYRNPSTGELSVMEENRVEQSTDADRVVDGQIRCSPSGKGRMIVDCEKRRKLKNPFAVQTRQ